MTNKTELNKWEQSRLALQQTNLSMAVTAQIKALKLLQARLFGEEGEPLIDHYPLSGILPCVSANSAFGSKQAYPVNTELARDIRDGCQSIYNALEAYNALVEGYCSGRVGKETL